MQQERRSRPLAPILPFVSLPLTREFSSNKHYFQQLAGIHHVYKARKYHIELSVQLLTALKAQGQNRNDWSWMCIPQSVQRVIQAISPLVVLTPLIPISSRILFFLSWYFPFLPFAWALLLTLYTSSNCSPLTKI